MLSLLAGEIAQRRYNPRSVRHYHGSSDRDQAMDILDHFTSGPAETSAYLQMLRIRKENMLSNPNLWRAVERLAATLMERRTIRGEEATQIIRDAFNADLYAKNPEMRDQDLALAARLNRKHKTSASRRSSEK